MGQTDEKGVLGDDGIRHHNRHQTAAGNRGKRGPGRPRNAPPNCRYVGWTQRHGHRYQACPRVGGKRVYGKYGTYEFAADDVAEKLRKARASAGIHFITLQDACQQVIDAAPKEGTKRYYDENSQALVEYFDGDTPLHEITRDRVREFIVARRADRVRGKPPSEGRIRKNLGTLGRVFNLAMLNDNHPGPSPLDRIEWPKANKVQTEGMHYEVAELAEIVKSLRARATLAARLLLLLFFSGLRLSELCRLRIDQIDRKAGLLRSVEGKTGPRNVPISKPLDELLRMQGSDSTGHVIPAGKARGPRDPENRPRTDLERRTSLVSVTFADAREYLRKELRGRFHPHTARHSVKTFLEANGVSATISDRFLGHGPRSVSSRYLHANPTEIRHSICRALDALASLVQLTKRARKAKA